MAIGPNEQLLIDGAIGYNNPVEVLYDEACEIWGPLRSQFESPIACFVSIGTGERAEKPWDPSLMKTFHWFKAQGLDTRQPARRFQQSESDLWEEQHYFRFNIEKGLETIKLDDYKKMKDIVLSTMSFIFL